MAPERAARTLANIGMALLALVLVLRVLSLTDTYAQFRQKPPGRPYEALPYLGDYTFSPSAAQVSFKQGWIPANPLSGTGRQDWFYLDLRNGLFSPGQLPPDDTRPFLYRDRRLWLLVGDGYSIVGGSPRGETVEPDSLARSPDRTRMAFITTQPESARLYVLYTSGRLDLLAQAPHLADPAWSPDGESLVFTMRQPDEPMLNIQVFRIRRDGTDLRQITHSEMMTSLPRWSADGRSIAYLQALPDSAPGIPSTDIGLIDESGAHPRQITSDGGYKGNLAWVSGTRRLVYITLSEDWPQVEELRVVDADAPDAQPVRFYPPVEIEAFECPKTLPRGVESTVQITIANSGPQPVAVPVALRSGPEPVPLFNTSAGSPTAPPLTTPPPNQPAAQVTPEPGIPEVRRQLIALNGGERRTLTWPIAPVPGLVTHLSAIVRPTGQYPVSEKHCAAPNTYLGLPNLPYLPSVLPLTITGLLLMVPWLRQQRTRKGRTFWLAAILIAVPVITIALIVFEIRFIR